MKQFFRELLLPRSDTTPSTRNGLPINQAELRGQNEPLCNEFIGIKKELSLP